MQQANRPPVPLAQRTFGEIVYWVTIASCILCTIGPLVAFIDMDGAVLNPRTLMQDIFDGVPAESAIKPDQDIAAGDLTIYLDKTKDFEESVDKRAEESGVDLLTDITVGDTVIRVTEMDINFHVGNTVLVEDKDSLEFAIIAAVDSKAMTITVAEGLINSFSAQRDGEVAEVEPKKVIIKDEFNQEVTYLRYIDEDNDALILMAGPANSYSMDDDAEVQEETIWRRAKDGVDGGHFWTDHLNTGDGIIQFGLVLGCSVGLFAMLGAAFILFFKEKSYGWGAMTLWVGFMILVSLLGIVSFE